MLKFLQPQMQPGTIPIGIQQIFTDVPEDEDGMIGCKKVLNLDVTKEAGNHSGYHLGCLDFLPLIDWAY